jgi:uncharacterized protein (TIGR00369 family)
MKTHAPLAFPAEIPFVKELGLELHACGEGRAELRLPTAQRHLNSWGVVHGGVLMTLLDVAMAQAARSSAWDATASPQQAAPGVATIEMKTTFLRAAQGHLRAVGTVLHRSPTLVFCEASAFDADDDLCAHGTGTFKILRALPVKNNPERDTP